jgi:hypothetical protein
MTTPNERAERERIRKRAARQGFKLSCSDDGELYCLRNVRTLNDLLFQDLAEVAEELRVRGKS